ncbi:MAG: Xaa-Pro peptidase family protein, partial [Planctomycetia bacterium]|nr:Xaa-Pro peptidase family protein [Planctomycetia bacterium]
LFAGCKVLGEVTVAKDGKRIARLKAGLKRAKLDALVLRLPENIVMSFGVWPMNGFSYAVFTADAGPVALIAPSCEDREMGGCWTDDVRFFTWPRLDMPDPAEAVRNQLRDVARRCGLMRARIGYEGNFEFIAPPHNSGEVIVPCETSIAYLKSILPSARWSDATDLLHEQRATKTEREIAKLRKVHRVASLGLKKFMTSVHPGVSEAQLASTVYRECLTKGVSLAGVKHVNVYPQISSGPNAFRAWRPVVTTGKRKLRSGEIAVLELAVCVDGFWADVTRVKVAGKPSSVQRAAFAAVKSAQAAALKCIKAGVRAERVHEIATKILVDAGFQKQIVHITGHGIGFRYHEPEPFLMPGNSQKLRAGHVCTVEPGLYDRRWGGIRIEENVVVRKGGVEILTKAPKSL